MSDTGDLAAVTEPAQLTPLAAYLGAEVAPYLGARTAALFSDVSQELSALTQAAGLIDRGYRVQVRITGEDRVRWLGGMVTNTVKALEPGQHNYTLVLNAQGRIQGDAQVFALADALLFETDRSQIEHLVAHLDRFIIMDDVELTPVAGTTSMGLSGPGASALLGANAPGPGHFRLATLSGIAVTLANVTVTPAYPRYDLWVAEDQAAALWSSLVESATPCGLLATEALRVLEGIPLYGADIQEKTLAQETGQMRALNFSKGCYLGQEIVERIRSRATVHRSIRQLRLEGEVPAPGTALAADGAPAGELTSVAVISLPDFNGTLALGTVRNELVERAGSLTYPGGSATLFTALQPA